MTCSTFTTRICGFPGTVGVTHEGCTVEALDAATDLFIDSLPVSVIL